MSKEVCLLSSEEVGRTLDRLAYEVLERHARSDDLAIIGVQRRGVQIASQIKRILDSRLGAAVPFGKLDINLYRDDWTTLRTQPRINSTQIDFPVEGKDILLVDDVLYSGRTVRAALEAVLDFGRPNRVELLVLVDRGHRELPIHADYVGKKINTASSEQVDVLVEDIDGRNGVVLQSRPRQ